jgi:hypothetical protein
MVSICWRSPITTNCSASRMPPPRQPTSACASCRGRDLGVVAGPDPAHRRPGVDPANQALISGLAQVRGGRDGRAMRIAAELARIGIHGAFEGALRYVGNPALMSRAHFARYLVRSACEERP